MADFAFFSVSIALQGHVRIDRPHPQPRKIRIRVQANFTPFRGAPFSFVKPARRVRGVNLHDAKLSAWGVNPHTPLQGSQHARTIRRSQSRQ